MKLNLSVQAILAAISAGAVAAGVAYNAAVAPPDVAITFPEWINIAVGTIASFVGTLSTFKPQTPTS